MVFHTHALNQSQRISNEMHKSTILPCFFEVLLVQCTNFQTFLCLAAQSFWLISLLIQAQRYKISYPSNYTYNVILLRIIFLTWAGSDGYECSTFHIKWMLWFFSLINSIYIFNYGTFEYIRSQAVYNFNLVCVRTRRIDW